MRALHVIFLVICFYLIYSVLAGVQSNKANPTDDVPSKAVGKEEEDSNRCLLRKGISLCQDERFKPFNMSVCWSEFLIRKIGNYDCEKMNTEYQHDIEAQKGANMSRKQRNIDYKSATIDYINTSLNIQNLTIFRNLYDFTKDLTYSWVTSWKKENIKPNCKFDSKTKEKYYSALSELVNSLPLCPCLYSTEKKEFWSIWDENSKKNYWRVIKMMASDKGNRCIKNP
ncbi:PREDICTED: uncharacterized protein LOC106743856 [Dinoponera quadriceps]|uniref:Uncharacterized protein LOC106743856 n=1 Tax=Dinoponera quadriceps TaxID=609295 RepID=A0A6P3X6P3_DINQU|nr:PREDICTED: uncharacterized protein LOC106743856 [Dinoponera quadriceps]